MSVSKYKFLPDDVALLFMISDLPVAKEKEIIDDLFHKHNSEIAASYRKDFDSFRKTVYDIVAASEIEYAEYNEMQMILDEFGVSRGEEVTDDIFGSYFRLIKLQLMYTVSYRKIKLRTLLKEFGYKRRSSVLNASLKNAVNALRIKTYIRNHEPCDLAEINLDQIVVMRLE